MPQARRSGAIGGRRLDLPPLFRLVTLREAGDAFAHACGRASELGAGAFVFVGRFDVAEFAVVLEPEEPLAAARRAFYAGMTALADALAAAAPPEKPIAIAWPDRVYVDGGLVGGGRLAWPDDADEQAVPDWLVFGSAVRTAWPRSDDPMRYPTATALVEEGFEDAAPERLAERFARHLMAAMDRWQEAGFAPIGRDYLARVPDAAGTVGEIASNGDFVIRASGGPAETRLLAAALLRPSWLDAAAGIKSAAIA